jgi:hypothetical protein
MEHIAATTMAAVRMICRPRWGRSTGASGVVSGTSAAWGGRRVLAAMGDQRR